MEENLVRLIKVVMSNMMLNDFLALSSENIVGNILEQAHVALHEEKRKELAEFLDELKNSNYY